MAGSASDEQAIPPQYRNPIIHDRGPSAYPGPYQVTNNALKAYGVARELFGTTEVLDADGSSFRVKDYQYALPDGSVGMTFLPVCDTGAATAPDGGMVYSSVLVDEFLRAAMKLQPEDQVFAFMYFIHPELNRGSVLEFAKSDKIELGITHMGAYQGGGRTTNSPPLYHNRGWGVKGEVNNSFGYPANVLILRMADTDQAMLNKNLALTDNVLNYGVRFPVDYKNSRFRPADINTALMFYRDWVLEEHYLRSDVSWFTYCAAHKTLVANIGLNLPHNLEAFREIYGSDDGAEFFKIFSQFHFEVFGTEFTPDLQTNFEPLWKKQGLAPAQIKPFTLAEYTAWDNARMNGSLDSFTGFKPVAPDVGTPWAPQMAADIVYDFVQSYADFVDAGAIAMTATVLGFADPVSQRLGVSKLDYLIGVMPIAQQAMRADACIKAAVSPAPNYHDSAYYQATFVALYTAFGGQDSNADAAFARVTAASPTESLWNKIKGLITGDLMPEVLAWLALERVREDWNAIIAGGAVPLATAYVDFMNAVSAAFAKDRAKVVSSPAGIQFNTPPAIGHMIGTGMFPCNQLVSLAPVLTVMNYSELERKPT